LTLLENYYTGEFNITLENVVNPSIAQQYTFNVSTFYDNTLMDTATVNATLYTIGNTISVSVIACPNSEGEWGIFNTTVTLSMPADTIICSLSSGFSSV
jgi:hypothetical protein